MKAEFRKGDVLVEMDSPGTEFAVMGVDGCVYTLVRVYRDQDGRFDGFEFRSGRQFVEERCIKVGHRRVK